MSHADDVVAANMADARVRAWLPWVIAFGGDIGPSYHLAWMAIESDGDPCSFTSMREAGPYQLQPGDNQNDAGTNEAELRTGCNGDTQQLAGSLPITMWATHVIRGTRYINTCRAKVETWTSFSPFSVDYWKATKMVHVAPAVLKQYGPASSSWDDFADRASATAPQSWIDNAAAVGAYGSPALLVGAAKLAALASAFYFATRRRTAA